MHLRALYCSLEFSFSLSDTSIYFLSSSLLLVHISTLKKNIFHLCIYDFILFNRMPSLCLYTPNLSLCPSFFSFTSFQNTLLFSRYIFGAPFHFVANLPPLFLSMPLSFLAYPVIILFPYSFNVIIPFCLLTSHSFLPLFIH